MSLDAVLGLCLCFLLLGLVVGMSATWWLGPARWGQ